MKMRYIHMEDSHVETLKGLIEAAMAEEDENVETDEVRLNELSRVYEALVRCAPTFDDLVKHNHMLINRVQALGLKIHMLENYSKKP